MSKFLVVIDTNVIVSALLTKHSDSSTLQILHAVFDARIVPIFNDEILNEYEEVLSRKKFNFDKALIKYIINSIKTNGFFSERIVTGVKLIDTKDLVFYEVLMSKIQENAFLVTGNLKHFPNSNFILSPNELLDILKNQNA